MTRGEIIRARRKRLQQLAAADYQPLYLNAIEYARNIKWEIDQWDGKNYNIQKWHIQISKYDRTTYIFNNWDQVDDRHVARSYGAFIMYLFDILNFGIIRPETVRAVEGTNE